MPISVFKRSRGGTEQIDIQEAYNIWNWLRIRYNSMETFQFYQNLVHDRDFSVLIDNFLTDTQRHMRAMELEGEKFKITLPNRPPLDLKFPASINQVTDKFIYKKIHADMMAELFTISRAVRSSTTNDRLRQIFVDDMLSHIRNFELLYKFSKLKSWEEVPPTYKTASPKGKENVTLTEAFHLWDHLSQRYDQLQMTNLFLGTVHDPDFKAILGQGVKVLSDQMKKLEQQVIKHEIILPERPPAHQKMSIDPETMTDKLLFGMIFTGIVEAIDLHMRAVIETIKNDPLRELFLELLRDEVSGFNKYLKYGKAKGWTKIPPLFGEPAS